MTSQEANAAAKSQMLRDASREDLEAISANLSELVGQKRDEYYNATAALAEVLLELENRKL